jgi:cytochrome c oxidase subunit 2
VNKAKNPLWTFLASATWPVAGIGADGPQEMSRVSLDRVDLHLFVLWICLAIGLVVFALMFYSFYHYRQLRNGSANAFHKNVSMEFLWALIPFAIVIGTAMLAVRQIMSTGDQLAADVRVTVTVDQCGGGYGYVVDGVSFAPKDGSVADQVIIIPAGRGSGCRLRLPPSPTHGRFQDLTGMV